MRGLYTFPPFPLRLWFSKNYSQLRKQAGSRKTEKVAASGQKRILVEDVSGANDGGMPSDSDSRITFIGRTNFRQDQRIFGIKQADRRAHTYLIGKTGTGKSTLLEVMVGQDIQSGQGVALLDPHGDLVERVLVGLPEDRKQ